MGVKANDVGMVLLYFIGFMLMYIVLDVTLLKQPIQWFIDIAYTCFLTVLYNYDRVNRMLGKNA